MDLSEKNVERLTDFFNTHLKQSGFKVEISRPSVLPQLIASGYVEWNIVRTGLLGFKDELLLAEAWAVIRPSAVEEKLTIVQRSDTNHPLFDTLINAISQDLSMSVEQAYENPAQDSPSGR